MNNKIKLQLRLNSVLHSKMKAIATNEKRTLNSQIEFFLEKSIEQYEKELQDPNLLNFPEHDIAK